MTSLPIAPRSAGALIASHNKVLRELVLQSLNGRWRPIQQVMGGAEALVKLEERAWQVLFLDRQLPDLSSEELTVIIQKRFPNTRLVLLDSDAVFREGGARETVLPVAKAVDEESTSESGNVKKQAEEAQFEPLPGMIGRSEAMQRVCRMAQLVAPRTTTVLIVGPTGSGKELMARALHALSTRSARPFVAVNCAAIPEALFEAELFGHARGAFTGAVHAQAGRIAAADGGTLFLDEVGELPFGMQAKLLRFLEQKELQRLGTTELTRVDVRVIAASNMDLAARTVKGDFREDLFYRLSAFPLELPPLAERREDIVPLARHFLTCIANMMSEPCLNLSDEAVDVLENHPWKGNVRELQHLMERASILVKKGNTVLSEHLYLPFQCSFLQPAVRPRSDTERAS